MRTALWLSLVMLVGCHGETRAQSCDALAKDVVIALQTYVINNHPTGTAGSECGDDELGARRVILSQGEKLLPCLLEIYRTGVPKGDLWPGTSEPSGEGKWAIALIREIDPKIAIPLYRHQYAKATDELARTQLAAETAILGDKEHVPELVEFLADHERYEASKVRDLTFVQERALIAISVHNYRPALGVLEELRKTWPYSALIGVNAAQLRNDTEQLEHYTRDSSTSETAVLALKRMGRDDLVRRISEDLHHPASKAAAAALSGSTGR